MKKQRGRFAVPTLLGLYVVTAGCGEGAQRGITQVQPQRPSFAITSPSQVSCDIDVIISASGTSAALGQEDVATFNTHIAASRVNGVTSVSATIDQIPGATIDLLRPALASPVPYVATDPIVPPSPDPSGISLPTQASMDSLAALPLDIFCHVIRDGGGPTLAPSAVGTSGTSTTTAVFSGGVAASTTTDQSSGLRLREVVTINGATVRDTRFEYASADNTVFRTRTTSDESMLVNGVAFFQRSEIVTRNVTRTLGGL